MKKFNEVIKIEVPVDSIAQQLLEHMNPEFKHKEQVVESIIGSALDNDSVNFIYNSLNGHSNDINFKVGDFVTRNVGIADSKVCRVVDINIYSKRKLKVEYYDLKWNSKTEYELKTNTVYHTDYCLAPNVTQLINPAVLKTELEQSALEVNGNLEQ